jgi:hypothetical protein
LLPIAAIALMLDERQHYARAAAITPLSRRCRAPRHATPPLLKITDAERHCCR